jgi:hypothetical protein
MQGRNYGRILGMLLLGWGLAWAAPIPAAAAAPAPAPEVQVSPNVLEIGAFFHGDRVQVTGKIPKGAQAVVEVVGQSAVEHLRRKGRRGGLWMNVGEVEVSGAPALYLAMSTDPKLLKNPAPDATWGYPALQRSIKFAGSVAPGEREMFVKQFFALQESEEIYATFPGALKAAGAEGDLKKVTGTLPLPTKVKPGTYQVRLTVIQDGVVTGKQGTELKVAMVGFPAMLSALAYQHGATYGILAVIIAIVTGFAMGYLFKGGGGH